MRTRAVTAVVLAVALLGTASCADGGASPRPVGVTQSTGAEPAPAGASASAAPAPETLRFTGRTLDGTPFSAAGLAGRPVVLWFWAPWCATCASQAWTVAEVAPAYRDTVPVIGVAGLGERQAIRDFVTEFELSRVPTLDDREGAIWRRFEVVEQSTFVLIDRNGRVIYQGFLDGEAFTRRLAQLAG
ncbi:redoxin [Micromonospora rosaria]|uniref:Redoxin n=1 Tax=Micromonospora rosaria TaxID=47874 RepID=A0A136PVU3_9ACTN|nr:TlpA disulfide reductase family protein [Micromonospora rosaria]KXK62483.1 redoxin [Micromonospora rosaria]